MRINILILLVVLCIILLIIYEYKKLEGLNESCSVPEFIVIDSGIPGPIIGLVGSIHGNEPVGSYTLTNMIINKEFKPIKGKLIVIKKANPCGLEKGVRENPWTGNDTNRQFNALGGMDKLSKNIENILRYCDLIIDFHEGWGWHLETINNFKTSMGSTISPSVHKFWYNLALKIVNNINKTIPQKLKKFSIIWNESCKIKSSLACYAHLNSIPYILVETSGQNNIQPMKTREIHNRIVIQTIFREFDIQ